MFQWILLVLHLLHLCRYLWLPQVSFRLPVLQSTYVRHSQSIAKFNEKKETLRKIEAYRSLVVAMTPRQALTF